MSTPAAGGGDGGESSTYAFTEDIDDPSQGGGVGGEDGESEFAYMDFNPEDPAEYEDSQHTQYQVRGGGASTTPHTAITTATTCTPLTPHHHHHHHHHHPVPRRVEPGPEPGEPVGGGGRRSNAPRGLASAPVEAPAQPPATSVLPAGPPSEDTDRGLLDIHLPLELDSSGTGPLAGGLRVYALAQSVVIACAFWIFSERLL